MTPSVRFALLAGFVVCVSPLAACTMTTSSDIKPLQSLTEPFPQSYFVNTANIAVETKYDPLANPKDVSSTFPTPPDLALKRYAETRLKAAGGQGTLHFVIEDASVFKDAMQSPNEMARWVNVDNKERYTAVLSIGLYRDSTGSMAPGATGTRLKAERTLTIPANVSLDERDRHLQGFMAQMLTDIDRSVTAALTDTLKLSTVEPAPSPGPYPVDPVEITPQHSTIESVPLDILPAN
jgi:hypothetical protein